MQHKKCYACEKIKPVEDFGKNRSRKDGLQAQCKQCDREHKNAQYAADPQTHIKYATDVKKRKWAWFNDLKKKCRCNRCGDSRWYVIDFHHKGDKADTVSQLVADNVSKERILAEISKCETLCANCHREIHYLQKLGCLA